MAIKSKKEVHGLPVTSVFFSDYGAGANLPCMVSASADYSIYMHPVHLAGEKRWVLWIFMLLAVIFAVAFVQRMLV